jgi:hypothetical protein
MSLKIQQIEPQLAQKLDLGVPLKNILHDFGYSVPEHYRTRISLLDANGRKKRSNASAENWSYESGRIEVWFEPEDREYPELARDVQDSGPISPDSRKSSSESVQRETIVRESDVNLLQVVVKTLDRAESRPGWNFVPLKKFRDEILQSENPELIATAAERKEALDSAIRKRLILVGKVLNPKAPEFPVTTVRLNRLMPDVQRLIGQNQNTELDFHPVEIRGEPLSATILRERR